MDIICYNSDLRKDRINKSLSPNNIVWQDFHHKIRSIVYLAKNLYYVDEENNKFLLKGNK